jgi:hypothetical protein
MIWLGLLKYGFTQEADLIKQGVLELAENHGFREYYDPYKVLEEKISLGARLW